jgi:outer membrane protein OmpA-like peptidoglycan-associated protein
MNRSNGVLGGIVVAGFFAALFVGFLGFLSIGAAAAGEVVSSQQILDALTAAAKPTSLADRLRLTRSPTFDDRDYAVASAQSMPHIDLEVYFDFDSAEITPQAEGQLRELGKALADSKLRGATISINGHTDGKGGDAFNKRLSERRAQSIKAYLVDNFALSAANLRTVGYGKSHLKNASDPFAAENRRVEVVNMVSQAQVQR